MVWGWFLFGLLVGDDLAQPQMQYEIQIYQCSCCGQQNSLEFGPDRPKKQCTPQCSECLTIMKYRVSYYR